MLSGCGKNSAEGNEVYGAARYDEGELDGLPAEALAASIGCANPVALAELTPGATVLDLAAWAVASTCLLSARTGRPDGEGLRAWT